jgi:hypothetical protein
MDALHLIAAAAITYFTVGTLVVLVHPRMIRDLLPELRSLNPGVASFLLKPILALSVFLLFCVLWPVAWFNGARSEKKRREAVAAQYERLKPFGRLYAAMNAPVRYSGGDGSSFDHAVIILGANIVNGSRAEYDYIEQRYSGYQRRGQSLKEHKGRTFDVLEFTTAAGENKAMYFDISATLASCNDA